jgi:PIN domain nuclease of toxin-antitoxin system
MTYLLDTHTYYWFRSAPQLLPAALVKLISNGNEQMLISTVTPWEMAIKTGINKMNATSLLLDFEARETAAGFQMAAISTAQAIRSGLLPSHHRDPFDRLLIAQSLELRIPIISRDPVFDRYGVERVWS